MAWLFLIVTIGAFLFTLPGGTRTRADRQTAQAVGFAGLAATLFALKLFPLGLLAAVVGGALFGIGWFKDKLIWGSGDDLDDDRSSETRAPVSREQMSREEALSVLGLQMDADETAIRDAHRRMIARAHPDTGGSDYLAAKINQARDVLLP